MRPYIRAPRGYTLLSHVFDSLLLHDHSLKLFHSKGSNFNHDQTEQQRNQLSHTCWTMFPDYKINITLDLFRVILGGI